MKKDKSNSASFFVQHEAPSDYKESPLKTLFRSALQLGSETMDRPRQVTFENKNKFNTVVAMISNSPEPTYEDLPHDSMPWKSTPLQLISDRETANLSSPPIMNGEMTSKPSVENLDSPPSYNDSVPSTEK